MRAVIWWLGSTASAERFDLPHEVLSAAQIRRLYPAFRVDEDWVALWERDAGYLHPEACVSSSSFNNLRWPVQSFTLTNR